MRRHDSGNADRSEMCLTFFLLFDRIRISRCDLTPFEVPSETSGGAMSMQDMRRSVGNDRHRKEIVSCKR